MGEFLNGKGDSHVWKSEFSTICRKEWSSLRFSLASWNQGVLNQNREIENKANSSKNKGFLKSFWISHYLQIPKSTKKKFLILNCLLFKSLEGHIKQIYIFSAFSNPNYLSSLGPPLRLLFFILPSKICVANF